MEEEKKNSLIKRESSLAKFDPQKKRGLIARGLKEMALQTNILLVKAIEEFKRAVKINPDDTNAHDNLICAFDETGILKDAIEEFEHAIRINTDNAWAHFGLGVAYYKSGMHKEAIEAYKQAIRLKPDYGWAHL